MADSSSPSPEDRDESPDDATSGENASGGAAGSARERGDVEGETEHVRRRLLARVGGLYALAQALTETEREARALVEATYERAAGALASGAAPSSVPRGERHTAEESDASDDDETRAWLFELLVEAARDVDGFARPSGAAPHDGPIAPGADAGDDGPDRHFRRRAQEAFLRRTLPAAFAALSPPQRLLLTLFDLEAVTLAQAARIVGQSEEDARRRHAEARADLRETLHQMAPRPERPLLADDALPDARLTEALRRMARRDLTAPPPALRPAARRALSRSRPPSTTHGSADGPNADRPSASPARSGADASPANSASERSSRRLPRWLVAVLLIGIAGGLGYFASAFLDGPGTNDLAILSARGAPDVDARLRTDRPAQAEQFVREQLGRRLQVPRIEGVALRGVGVAEVAPGERVPVFLFHDAASGRPITAYAYDYALLDRAGDRLHLPPHLRRHLESEGRVATEDVEDRRVLLWRHRDDIFAAVTTRADSLQQRMAL